ncbi:MAG: tetratricopeptide repeat protein [Candidatus Aegiribacteria sp.]|nr:tetratricopeptide repeat protein [Candidatus Aegiribacteria sp.]
MADSMQVLEDKLESVAGKERIELLIELSLRNFKVSPTKARSYAEEALVMTIHSRSRSLEAKALNALGRANLGQFTHVEALKHLHMALSIYEELDSKQGIAEVFGSIALVYHSSGEHEDALEYLDKSRVLFEGLDDRIQLANNLNSTGVVLIGLDRNEEALKYLEESLAMAIEEDDNRTMRSATNNIGILHFESGNLEKAIVFYKKAAELSEQQGELKSLAGNCINIGQSNLRLGNYDDARKYLNRGLEIAEQSEALDFTLRGCYSLCDLYEKEGDFEKALEYHRRVSELQNKLFTLEKSKAIAEIDARYQTEKAEQETEIHRLKNIELAEKNQLIEAQAESLQKANLEISAHKEELIEKNLVLEELLKEKDDFLSRMVAHISDGVMIDDQNGKILYANDRFLKIFGFSRNDILNMDFFRCVTPEWRENVRDYHIRRLAGEDVPDRFEFEGLKKGGGRIWLEVGVTVVERDGVVQGTQSLICDITNRKTLEAQLLQSQKLDAVGRLAGGIAHDFNNLLTLIKAHSEFILADLSETHPLQPDAEEISKAADRASALTRQLLAFSRQQILQPRVLDISRVVSGLQRMLSRLLSEDIQLVTFFSQDAGCVFADESQIEQVIVNLVINARDAMESGGKLTINVSNVDIDEHSLVINPDLHPGQYVQISISDTGTGMNADTQARIFEPFYSTKLSEKGSGLGLAMVYGIIMQSNGVIEVSSEPKVGTTFTVNLPRVKGEHIPDEVQAVKSVESGKGESILLVEDDEALKNVIERYLSREEYNVVSAGSAEEALELFEGRSDKFQFLLTDVVLPGINGVVLASQLKENGFNGSILYMTGYTKDASLLADVKNGYKKLLEKPFSLNTLGQMIRDLLDTE